MTKTDNFEYISTRDERKTACSFYDVLLSGLAKDGGLYVPTSFPHIELSRFFSKQEQTYQQTAMNVLRLFLPSELSNSQIETMVYHAYENFDHAHVSPLKHIDKHQYIMELFHGPTLAFKDFAMQILSQLMTYALAQHNKEAIILGATSGDTGSAAIEAFKNKPGVKVFILFPQGRVSERQQYQMTATGGKNIYPLAVEGTFDDCQNIVKSLFVDDFLPSSIQLCGVNSINWFRIVAQIIYYFYAYNVLRQPLNFSVPTGNFGNVLAGYYAQKIGLPINKLIIATNENDVLYRTWKDGNCAIKQVKSTMSPSMDIQISSNFERLIYDMPHSSVPMLKTYMKNLRDTSSYTLAFEDLLTYQRSFEAHRIDEQECHESMHNLWKNHSYLADPHTAIAFKAAQNRHDSVSCDPIVSLATAHPCKFPDAVKHATGQEPSIPDSMGVLLTQKQEYDTVTVDKEHVKKLIIQRIS